jgi:hypothetical protein
VGSNKDKNGLDNKFELFTIIDSKDNKRFEDIDQINAQMKTEADNNKNKK